MVDIAALNRPATTGYVTAPPIPVAPRQIPYAELHLLPDCCGSSLTHPASFHIAGRFPVNPGLLDRSRDKQAVLPSILRHPDWRRRRKPPTTRHDHAASAAAGTDRAATGDPTAATPVLTWRLRTGRGDSLNPAGTGRPIATDDLSARLRKHHRPSGVACARLPATASSGAPGRRGMDER